MPFEKLIGGFAKSVILGQLRTYLPAVGGVLGALGVHDNQVNAASLEGSIYYIISSLFVLVPSYFSYRDKHTTKDLVDAAISAVPNTPAADALKAKVS